MVEKADTLDQQKDKQGVLQHRKPGTSLEAKMTELSCLISDTSQEARVL